MSQNKFIKKFPFYQRNLFRFVFKQLDRTCSRNQPKLNYSLKHHTTSTLVHHHHTTLSHFNQIHYNHHNTLFIESVYKKLQKRIDGTPYLKQFFLGPPIVPIKGDTYKGNPSSWMNDLKGVIGDYPLNRLIIPGTRASFSNNIHEFSIISPDGKSSEQLIYKTLKYYPKNVLNRVQANWSKSQSKSALLQLRDGIRYFDIRVCRDGSTFKKTTMLKSCHTMFDRPIEDSLNEIVQFMIESPQEIIILDFTHFFDMNSNDHNYLIGVLKKKFGMKLLTNSIQPTSSLNEIWKTSQRLIINYNHEQAMEKYGETHSMIHYVKPIVRNTHDLFMSLSRACSLRERKRNDEFLFAIQSTLTPDDKMIASGIIGRPSTSMELAHFHNNEMVNWLSTQALPRRQVNIIIFDHYSKEMMNVIIQQNTIKI